MQIHCPVCEATLSVGQPKPGTYRPRCKHCQQTFRLQVSSGDPPRLKVTPDSASTPSPQKERLAQDDTAQDATAANREPRRVSREATHADVEATRLETDATRADVESTIEATQDASPLIGGDQNRARADATVGEPDATVGEANRHGERSESVVRRGKEIATARRPAAGPGDSDGDIPERLGGYRILRLLGRGAMGAVYEAKQISLDRLVALKTIRGRFADNAASLARFTREAYAAAQLTHHNVVQIYDFGEDNGKHFFSMEWVRGGPLSELVKEKGSLEPRLAAGYLLQAARGLQFAHRHGMVHRDIKPANLLLSEEGVVKVADLGLVKIADQFDQETDLGATAISGMASGTQVTMQGTAVGTPAYMAPEQGIDAATVDHRADIYSLGCTLVYLLTGKPPYDAKVVSEVMQQHSLDPLPELTNINARIPRELQKVVHRSMAKRPDDRYGSVAQMIADLESYLGVVSAGEFSPSVGQADQWERLIGNYAEATGLLRWNRPLMFAFLAAAGLLTIGLPWLSWRLILTGPALVFGAAGVTILAGARDGRSAVATSLRRWFGSLSWGDHLVGAAVASVITIVCLLTGLWTGLALGTVLGAATGIAYHVLVVRPTRQRSAIPIAEAERFVRDLRIGGADEEGIRLFAARYGGPSWQRLFESLFGYEAMCKTREQLASDPSVTEAAKRILPRDRLCANLDSKAERNRHEADHRRLAKIEQRGLQSEGVTESEARDRAWQMAAAVMQGANDLAADGTGPSPAVAEAKRQRMKAMLADARSGKYATKREPMGVVRFALGGQTRLLAGCLLLATFGIWAYQSGFVDQVTSIAGAAATDGNIRPDAVTRLQQSAAAADSDAGMKWSIGIAGLLLALSAFVSGWRMTPFAVIATLVILFAAPLGLPEVALSGRAVPPWVLATFAGILIYLPGIWLGEAQTDRTA